MRDYQLRSLESYVLPRSVYYQCIWTVRDLDRIHKLAVTECGIEYDGDNIYQAAREREAAINAALDAIPSEYRRGIISNILDRLPYGDEAHENTWKKWKQRFIYELAVNLKLV